MNLKAKSIEEKKHLVNKYSGDLFVFGIRGIIGFVLVLGVLVMVSIDTLTLAIRNADIVDLQLNY